MGTRTGKGIATRLKELEARGDAWAVKHLTPEQMEDATALDLALKRNFRKWLGSYLAATALTATLLVGIKPSLGWLESFGLTNLLAFSILACIASAWYGWNKYAKQVAWKSFLTVGLLTTAGGLIGLAIGHLSGGQTLTDISQERVVRIVAIGLLMGLTLAATLVSIARFRVREMDLRAARLKADAERERLTRQGVQAELKLLQAQVEPHFLFNTLSNLRFLVQTGSPDALAMLDHLIHYLRTALPEIRAESSTLGREVELARAYLEILRLRMGGALEIAIDVPEALAAIAFPALMVMTLVENAVKHGVAPVGRGRIAIRAVREAGRLRIAVEDDGRGLVEPLGRGIGLTNLRERLRAVYGEAARLELVGRDPAGTTATIDIPEALP